MCKGCGANIHDKHNFCPECGDNLNDALPIKKNHSFTCLECGNQLDNGEKFCPQCGTKHPGYNPVEAAKAVGGGESQAGGRSDDGSADKAVTGGESNGNSGGKKAKKAAKIAKKATPTDAAEEAADADPVPEHREPDGPAIEALEHDAGLPTVPDSSVKTAEIFFPGDLEASASMRLKMLNVPADYGMLHDLTCPCFHPDDVAKSYPTYDLTRLDVEHWQRKAFDMAASAPLDEARKATELWQHVVTLKGTDPRYLVEVRSDLYKEFRDANPGPGTFPSPGAIHPGSFNRAFVTGGHAAVSPGYSGPNTSPGSFGQISASMYDRGALTDGHAAESPSANRGSDVPVSIPTNPGVPTRTYYTNAVRNNARQAMSAMHDHIASTFPDLCPAYTTASPYGSENLPGSRPVPAGVGGPKPHGAAKAAKKAKKAVEPIPVETPVLKVAEVTKAATLDVDAVQDIVTKAVTAVNEARDAEVKDLQKTIKKMRKRLDEIAAQPDPGGPYRGVAFDQIVKTVKAQEVLPSVQRVEHAQEAMFRAMYDQFRNDPNPMQREAALRELMKMSGITNNSVHK
jgi:RNA polymerase subunit RPABC4/transcription elongation factor Spt4